MADRQFAASLEASGPWSFSQSVRFLEAFTPAAIDPTGETVLRLAFVPDGSDVAAGVSIRPDGDRDDRVIVRVSGQADPDLAVRQVQRMLSLDHDGRGVTDVADRDPVIGRLWAELHYLRPVLFNSPYEAAAWAIIGNRIRIRQAARIKAEMAKMLGTGVDVDGHTVFAFPAPARLAELTGFPGLTERKVEWLKGVGEAASQGVFGADRLRQMSSEAAISALSEQRGIGPFGAELILLRGAGERDRIPRNESRFGQAVAMVYGFDDIPGQEALDALAEPWRPYRTWVAVLLRSVMELRTHEISGS